LISEIHTQELVKIYRNRTVVNHVSVNVKQGEIVGNGTFQELLKTHDYFKELWYANSVK
jgi:ABC-type lipopolysaccharide export system ATPase subunit